MQYLLAIDNGGTNTKAAVFDTEGRMAAVSSFATPRIEPGPQWREVDTLYMWDAVCRAIRDCIAKAGITGADIAGAACVGHGKGLYLVGKDGRPARNGILSTDNRAWKYIEDWYRDGTFPAVWEISRQHILSMQPPALLRWVKDNEPDVYGNIRYILECKDFVRYLLTGEAGSELTDISGSNLLNLSTGAFDRRLFDLYGIPEMFHATAPICRATDLCGRVTKEAAEKTGLPEGLPVAGGMFDVDASAVAMDLFSADYLCSIAGTWSINEYISEQPVLDGSILMNSLYAKEPFYLIEESSPTSAGNLDIILALFFKDMLEKAERDGVSVYKMAEEMVERSDPAAGILFLPFLYGSNSDPLAKAAFIGLQSGHSAGQLLRAVFEGVAFSHRQHIDKLLGSRRTRPLAVRLAGGAAQSVVWVQMFSDVLNLPVQTVEAKELGALGGAMAAAVAAGIYRDLKDAAQRMTRIASRVLPDSARAAVFEKKYAAYRAVVDALLPVWREIHADE